MTNGYWLSRVARWQGRQTDEARDAKARPFAQHRQGIVEEVFADNLHDACEPALVVRPAGQAVEPHGRSSGQGESYPGVRHGKSPDDIGDRLSFGPVALQELQPGRCGGEEVADLDRRSRWARRRLHGTLAPGVDRDPHGTGVAVVKPGHDIETRHGPDGGEGLAAKSERDDVGKIVREQFRRRVAFDREPQVLRRHAGAVIRDADEIAATGLDHDVDAGGARIQRVLDQLLDGGGRPLDDLTGRDAVDQDGVEAANRHGDEDLRTPASPRAYTPTGRPTMATSNGPWPNIRLATRRVSSIVTASISPLRSSR